MPERDLGAPAWYRSRTVYRNRLLQLDHPGLIARAYLELLPTLNAAAPAAHRTDLPENELSLDVRARAWIAARQGPKESWP